MPNDKGLSEAEFTEFLGIRNRIIHPDPHDTIESLHLIYDKLPALRWNVYEFLVKSIGNNAAKTTEAVSE